MKSRHVVYSITIEKNKLEGKVYLVEVPVS